MRPGNRADEAKSLPPCPSGNRRSPRRVQFRRWIPALALLLAALQAPAQTAQPADLLPDSPGTIWSAATDLQTQSGSQTPAQPGTTPPQTPPPCTPRPHRHSYPRFHRDRCDPYRPFVDKNAVVAPLTAEQKGYLAIHDFTDPFNLLTITATSAFTIGINSHSAYGPGMHGFGLNVGTSLSQDLTGEAIGTFAVCALFREDPRYFRMPQATFKRRLWHALARIAVAQGDNGRVMPNYQNFITAVAGSVIANQYVPGLATDPTSTTERILSGFATEPIGPIIAEFLPDVAARIHIHIVVVQRLLNQISAQPAAQ